MAAVRRTAIAACALVALTVVPHIASAGIPPDGTWPMFRYDAAHTGYNSTETTISTSNVSTLTTQWTGTTGFQTNLNSSPSVGGGRVYVGDGNGAVSAFDVETGALDWSADVANTPFDTGPALSSTTVFIGTCDTIYALDAADGTTAWATTLIIPGPHGCNITSPTLFRGVVFVGSYGSKGVHALRGSDGTLLWSSLPTGGPIESSPAVANGMVYAGSDDGSVYAYPAQCTDPCAPAWSRAVGSAVQAAPAVWQGRVFVGALNGYVYAMNALTGAPLWRGRVRGQVRASPAAAGPVVFGSGTGGDLVAFNASTGSKLWSVPFAGGDGSVALANGVLYISASGNVEGFDAMTGQFLWGGYVVYSASSPAVTGGQVYASVQGVTSGTVYAWGLP